MDTAKCKILNRNLSKCENKGKFKGICGVHMNTINRIQAVKDRKAFIKQYDIKIFEGVKCHDTHLNDYELATEDYNE